MSLSPAAAKGKMLFQSKCGSCHHPARVVLGPALKGFESRGPWSDRKKLYDWIRNPADFMKQDVYTRDLMKLYGFTMTPSPDLSETDIDAIVEYISH